MRRLVVVVVVGLMLVALVATTNHKAGKAKLSSLRNVKVSGASGVKPKITFHSPFSTTKSGRRVIIDGRGATLAAGAKAVVDFVGIDGRTAREFATSYGKKASVLTLDREQVLVGLVNGLIGTRVGSRVLVAVAPKDGFKGRGGSQDGAIKADDTVLFVVDIRSTRTPLPRATGTPVAPPAGLPTVRVDERGRPTIDVPASTAPSQLVAQPLIQGAGPKIEKGQTLTVHYTGVIWPGGKQFDSSWDRNAPVDVVVGGGAVIPGWDEGLVGQTVGSQMLLVVPPDKGYGSAGNTSAGISGTDTLVFVVDILDAS